VAAALAAGLIAHGAPAAPDASPTGLLLRVTLSPYATAGKPLGYQIQLANASRRKDSSPATLRNVVLMMNLPHQSILGNSTLNGYGMSPTSFSRRFSVSGVGGSVVEWRVAKIDPQDYFTFDLYTKVATDAGNRLCGSFTATATGRIPKRKSFCLAVRPA
jgi:hypothetical protein